MRFRSSRHTLVLFLLNVVLLRLETACPFKFGIPTTARLTRGFGLRPTNDEPEDFQRRGFWGSLWIRGGAHDRTHKGRHSSRHQHHSQKQSPKKRSVKHKRSQKSKGRKHRTPSPKQTASHSSRHSRVSHVQEKPIHRRPDKSSPPRLHKHKTRSKKKGSRKRHSRPAFVQAHPSRPQREQDRELTHYSASPPPRAKKQRPLRPKGVHKKRSKRRKTSSPKKPELDTPTVVREGESRSSKKATTKELKRKHKRKKRRKAPLKGSSSSAKRFVGAEKPSLKDKGRTDASASVEKAPLNDGKSTSSKKTRRKRKRKKAKKTTTTAAAVVLPPKTKGAVQEEENTVETTSTDPVAPVVPNDKEVDTTDKSEELDKDISKVERDQEEDATENDEEEDVQEPAENLTTTAEDASQKDEEDLPIVEDDSKDLTKESVPLETQDSAVSVGAEEEKQEEESEDVSEVAEEGTGVIEEDDEAEKEEEDAEAPTEEEAKTSSKEQLEDSDKEEDSEKEEDPEEEEEFEGHSQDSNNNQTSQGDIATSAGETDQPDASPAQDVESSTSDELDIPIHVDEVEITLHVDKEDHVSVRMGDGQHANATQSVTQPAKHEEAEEEDDAEEEEEDAAAALGSGNMTATAKEPPFDAQAEVDEQAQANTNTFAIGGSAVNRALQQGGEKTEGHKMEAMGTGVDQKSVPSVPPTALTKSDDSEEDEDEDEEKEDEDEEEDEDEDEDDVDSDNEKGKNENQNPSAATTSFSSSPKQNLSFNGGSMNDADAHIVSAEPDSALKEKPKSEATKATTRVKRRRKRTTKSDSTTPARSDVSTDPESHTSDMKVSVVTWNLAESSPSEEEANFLRQFRDSDLVLISGQECENIKPRRTEGHRSREYRRLMIKMLGKKFVPVGLHMLGGIQFGLFCRRSCLAKIESVTIADVTCGIGNVFHNKGAIAAFVKVKARTSKGSADEDATRRAKSLKMLFVTAHLAAHVKNTEARDADFWRVVQELESQAPPRFLPPDPALADGVERRRENGGSGSYLLDSMDRVFFCGDLNYRINLPREEAEHTVLAMEKTPKEAVRIKLRERLLRHDQLLATMAEGNAFTGLCEGKIAFLPTFKFDKGTDEYDTSHKQRIPAWTDRVVFKPTGTRILRYESVPNALHSDHRPVFASFQVSTLGSELPARKGKRSRRRRED